MKDDLKLLEDLECNIMLVPAESRSQIAEEILLKRAMRTLTGPTIEDMLAPKDGPIYPYTKRYSQARNEPFVVLNTSGSTGPPKPVRLNHGTVAHHDLFMHAKSLGGKPLNIARFSGKRVLFSISQFHSPAVCFLAFSVYSRTVPVLLP